MPMKQYSESTPDDFFIAYQNGQRHFYDLDFEYDLGFAHNDFSNVIFENCFLYIDFSYSNLTNSKFIGCNIKEIDLTNADLSNSFMTRCLVESAIFDGANVINFKFIDNYCYGNIIGQKEFDEQIYKP